MMSIFLSSMIIGYSGAVAPGSLLTYTLNRSIKDGAKAGLLISIGHGLLELVLVITIFLGIGKYLSAEPVQMVIGLLGGLVLLFFGITMAADAFRGKINIDFDKQAGSSNYRGIIASSVLISATNPYFIIWWAAVGLSLIMNAFTAFGIMGVALFYLGHIMADFTWYCFVSALVSKARHFINQKLYKGIIVFLASCMAAFGLSFLIPSVKTAWMMISNSRL